MKVQKKHLPFIGVGPLIVTPQLIFTAGMIFTARKYLKIGWIPKLKVPCFILGIAIILFGLILWYQAVSKSKIEKCITENKLATTGVYSLVRNPIYSAFFLFCTGAVVLTANLILLLVPFVCWAYMTVFLINTEEKWLKNLYGQEYLDYCKRVNRCIPWYSEHGSFL